MLAILRVTGLGLLLVAAACQSQPATPNSASAAPAPVPAAPVAAATPDSAPASGLLSAPPDTMLARRIEAPQLNDVYVVAYQPSGGFGERYFFYRVSRITPTIVDLLPARQESTDPATDVSAAGFFTDKALTYTRAEALELVQEQPGDVQHTRLVQIRR
ncbi:hypothetical protein [Hymenobacter psychrophilus]|uniref:Uncharacterized protein n=1 Tax=Hymenobacter psychrophilus TaxID=651662 RepID=A0A1H3GXW4_9BACT|nr:hypothetical protein [Hymenobacter psychrophilus]SDY07478.1 hypothetical protein SAMN04488069_105196 [Hymenobacter psychrophilus]